MSLLLDVIASCGLSLLLVAFVLNKFKKIVRNTFTFNGLNFIGHLILAYYAFAINSRLFIYFESVWVFTSLYFLLRKTHHHIKHRNKKSEHRNKKS